MHIINKYNNKFYYNNAPQGSSTNDNNDDKNKHDSDIFDDDLRDDNALTFLKSVSGKYPCAYVTGNHEYWSGADSFAEKMAILR